MPEWRIFLEEGGAILHFHDKQHVADDKVQYLFHQMIAPLAVWLSVYELYKSDIYSKTVINVTTIEHKYIITFIT